MAASASSHATRLPRKRHVLGSSGAAASSSASASDLSPLRRGSPALHEYQEQGRRRPSRQSNRIGEEQGAATSSSISDLSSSDDDDHDKEDFTSSHARRASSRKSTKKATATWRPDRRYTGRKQRWSQDEDRLLITAVDRHGKHWEKIYAVLKNTAAPGGPHRTQATLNNRYSLLLAQAVRQRDLAASSAPRQQQQHQSAESVASLLAASKALHAMAAQLPTPWTRTELDKLAALGPLADGRPAVYEAFCLAFPRTTRTQRSVINKWQRIRAAGGKGRRRRYCKEHEQEENKDDAEGSESGSEDVEAAMGMSEGMARSKRSLQRSRAPGRGGKTSNRLAATTTTTTTTTTRPQAPLQRSARLPLQSSSPRLTHLLASPAHSLSCLDVTIKLEHDGFRISSLPPGYGLLIHSPTQCQVLSPDELLLLVSKDLEQGQEGDVKPMLAPFAFKAANDGSIQALALPLGSTMSVSLVPAAEVGQQVGRHGCETRQRAMTMVESHFQGPDGYLVVFTSRLE